MIDYGSLARTPSGALTAESKRRVEADRIKQRQIQADRYVNAQKRRDLVEALKTASDELEAFDARTDYTSDNWETDREEAQYDQGFAEGEKQGTLQALEERDELIGAVITNQINRMKYHGLDAHTPALEILERLEMEVSL